MTRICDAVVVPQDGCYVEVGDQVAGLYPAKLTVSRVAKTWNDVA
jgi:hypothetical protein